MPVYFDGATSGNREDAKPSLPTKFDTQKPQDTSGGNAESNIQWSQCSGNREGLASPDVPKGGSPDDSAT